MRALEISQRAGLRTPGPSWPAAFASYLRLLECPLELVSEVRAATTHITRARARKRPNYGARALSQASTHDGLVRGFCWLITRAVACEYEDHGESTPIGAPRESFRRSSRVTAGEEYNKAAEAAAQRRRDHEHIRRICERAGVPCESGPLQALRGLRETQSGAAACAIDLAQFPLGFSTGDDEVDRVATVLRILYLSDLRELQNGVNELLVTAQEYTANPVTNAHLGKVGR